MRGWLFVWSEGIEAMINKSNLEEILAPYAEAPVRYPESVEPRLIRYMKQQHKKMLQCSGFMDSWLLMVKGQIRVLYTILLKNQMLPSVKFGTLDWSNNREKGLTLTLHYWIDVDIYRIDYRGRDWYRILPPYPNPLIEQVPYGVFIPKDFPWVDYEFKRVEQMTPIE